MSVRDRMESLLENLADYEKRTQRERYNRIPKDKMAAAMKRAEKMGYEAADRGFNDTMASDKSFNALVVSLGLDPIWSTGADMKKLMRAWTKGQERARPDIKQARLKHARGNVRDILSKLPSAVK